MDRHRCLAVAIVTLTATLIWLVPLGQAGASAQAVGYVGSEICQGCHQEIYGAFKAYDPHWKNIADDKVPSAKRGCESCHGPGEKHANGDVGAIFSFKNKDAKVRSDGCLVCHQKQKDFFQFGRSMHKLNAVACNDCHGVHGGRTNAQLLKRGESAASIRTAEGQGRGYLERHLLVAPETELCLSCHQEVKAKFYLPTRHKVLEGAVKCTDCHTPHGTMQRASLRKWNRFNDAGDACFQCHPEKRGPWVFEHAAGKAEGCMVCHVPHGSANRFLLIRKDVRRVCLECHGARHFNPQSCITCHTQVHGSNFSKLFFQ